MLFQCFTKLIFKFNWHFLNTINNPEFITGIQYTYHGYFDGIKEIPIEFKDQFSEVLKEHVKNVLSNTNEGFKQKVNRRYPIYKRLVNREFSNDWNISFDDKFCNITLNRK